MDDADRAYKLINETINDSIAKLRESLNNNAKGRINCIECGYEISEARRVAINTEHCIDCAE